LEVWETNASKTIMNEKIEGQLKENGIGKSGD
jgi:hypothetical protein